MIDRAIGIASLALGIISLVLPAIMPHPRKRWAWTGGIVGLLLLAVAGGTLLLPSSDAQPADSSIVAPGNSGIITQGQTGGTNVILQGPPRLPLALYQYGQQIGAVEGGATSADGKQITLTNPRIASGTVNFSADMEFQNLLIRCPEFVGQHQAAFNAVSILGAVRCDVVGKR